MRRDELRLPAIICLCVCCSLIVRSRDSILGTRPAILTTASLYTCLGSMQRCDLSREREREATMGGDCVFGLQGQLFALSARRSAALAVGKLTQTPHDFAAHRCTCVTIDGKYCGARQTEKKSSEREETNIEARGTQACSSNKNIVA